jgi:hypothetical protein
MEAKREITIAMSVEIEIGIWINRYGDKAKR